MESGLREHVDRLPAPPPRHERHETLAIETCGHGKTDELENGGKDIDVPRGHFDVPMTDAQPGRNHGQRDVELGGLEPGGIAPVSVRPLVGKLLAVGYGPASIRLP